MKMKVIIIGSSIAGAAMALALSDYAKVLVYEQKKEEDVSKKVCGNICTSSIEKYANELGLEEDFILSRYNKLKIFSKQNEAEFPTNEYEIDRRKLLREIVGKARKNSVQFNFHTRFSGFERKNGKFIVHLESARNKFEENADILIGADGALSEVAKSAGLFGKREFFLFLQTKVNAASIKNKALIPDKNSYNIFVGKNYGYYSYIFPSRDGKELKIGLGDDSDKDVSTMFSLFMEKLGTKKGKIEGALVPKPKVIRGRKNFFLIGDASCNLKYTGGGIVPDMEQVLALRDRILKKGNSRLESERRKLVLNRRITRMVQKMGDRDFDILLEILKKPRFKNAFSFRDDLGKGDIMKMLSPELIWTGLRIALRH